MLPERKPQVLVVDDELNLRRVLAAQLMRDGYDVHLASDGIEGLGMLRDHHVDLLITDLKMPRMDGMELLREALQLEPRLPVVMITAHGTVDTAVQALKTGAFDYITKPFDQTEVRAIVHKALQTHAASRTDARGRDAASVPGPVLVGQSPAIVAVNARLAEVARQASPVVVIGEVGTGKELVARGIHDGSSRRERPFIKVNCAAIAPEVIASELFGVASASTASARPGRVELAALGTLFLDEVAAIPKAVQLQLVEACRSGGFERQGGVGRIPFEARVIAASRSDVVELAGDAVLCAELAELLRPAVVKLPPLRDRREDIPYLCSDLIAGFNARFGKQVTAITDEAALALAEYSWPGNIRELENALEQAVLLCEGDVISVAELPPHLFGDDAPEELSGEERGLKAQVKAITARVERQLINKALQQTQGNVTHAARLLKISRKGLQLKMKELGLRERDE